MFKTMHYKFFALAFLFVMLFSLAAFRPASAMGIRSVGEGPVQPAMMNNPAPAHMAPNPDGPQIMNRYNYLGTLTPDANAPQDNPAAQPQDNPAAQPQDNPAAQPQDNPAAQPQDDAPAQPAPVAGDLDQATRVQLMQWFFWQNHGDIPVQLLLAIAARESGRTYNNTVNPDGIMQVTPASGLDVNKPYNNTYDSVRGNLEDALNIFNRYLASVRATDGAEAMMTTQDGARVDTTGFLADLPYSDYIRAALRYNAGSNPAELYNRGAGDPGYLGHLADELENGDVAAISGGKYSMDDPQTRELVDALREAQARVTYQINNYYAMYQAN